MSPQIEYRSIQGYKYEFLSPYGHDVNPARFPCRNPDNGYLTVRGRLLIAHKGYAWDGASGPALDTPTIMRASLIHDAMYQCIRDEHVAPEHAAQARAYADAVFRRVCLADGMWRVRAWWVWAAVRLFGWAAV